MLDELITLLNNDPTTPMLFTTSWDDGYALDLKLAKLLEKYSCTGTFYACPVHQHSKTISSEEDIRKLSSQHEIGAHSLTHRRLTQIPPNQAEDEIRGSKQWIENITEKPCRMFCYPKGDLNVEVKEIVKHVGFLGARTTEFWKFYTEDPYTMPVSIQIMPFPWRRHFSPAWKFLDPLGPLRAHWGSLNTLRVPLVARRSWLSLATTLFDQALHTNQPMFHLYGHSHEVEQFGLWEALESFLAHVQQSDVRCVTNYELLDATA